MSNLEVVGANEKVRIKSKVRLTEGPMIVRTWTISKFRNAEERAKRILRIPPLVIRHNLLLNEGMTEMLNLICGLTATAFSNANAHMGVGDSATAAVATQTGLQAATNKFYNPVDATYPQVSAQTATWQSTFVAAEANFTWNEITVANGNSDAADNINRLVQAMGTKASPAEWEVKLQLTLQNP